MKLSDRKKKILQIVVDDYVSTAQPVSSKSITEKYLTNVSSATVRSELAQLEELGYLTQPHTSSGRVPSIEAYKLYVSELMDKSKLTSKELSLIRKSFIDHADNLEEVVQNAVKVISDLTDYTSVACTSHSENEVILKIDIFRHKKNQALLLLLTENTLIRDKFINIPESMTDEQIEEAGKLLAKLFTGKKFCEIINLSSVISEEFVAYKEIFKNVMDAIEDYVINKKGKVFLEGEGKILDHINVNDTEKMKGLLSVLTGKENIAELLTEKDKDNDVEINVRIGNEERKDMPEDSSLVTATYSVGGVKIGTYGVIGPLRMDYRKVVSVLEAVGKILEDVISNKE